MPIRIEGPRARPTSGLLISYAPPYAPNALMPDNGLASLAASLRSANHQVQIQDFCTTQTIRRLFTPKVQEALGNIWHSVKARIAAGKNPRARDLVHLLWINRQMEKRQTGEALEVAGQLRKVVSEREVDWVGFKLWNGAGFTIPVRIAEELKRTNPQLKILAGGSHVDYFREQIFRYTRGFDVLVFGDGEQALLKQVERIGGRDIDPAEIPNSIFRKADGSIVETRYQRIENLSELPLPAYDEETYPAMKESKIKIIVIDESRGCDNFCHFCGHANKSGGRIVSKEPKRVVEEMVKHWTDHGISYFRFAGSSTPGSLLKGVAEEMLARGLKFRFTTFARVKDAVPEDYPLLRQAGHFGQFFGIESGSQKILSEMGKRVSRQEIERVISAALENEYFTVLSFIGSPPGETAETRQETLGLIEQLRPQSAMFTPPMVIPHTRWAQSPQQYGIELKGSYLSKSLTYPVRFLLPLRLWPKLPYRIDGKSSSQIFSEVTEMTRAVERAGIPTGISDDMALMAKASGMDPVHFRDLTREYFFTGNAEAIDQLVFRINQGIIDPSR